jgi:hypothetical protein
LENSSPPFSHHRISDERYYRDALHPCQVLPLLQYEHRRVFKWVKLNVADPERIHADRAQPHSGQAALHAKG